MRRRQLLAAAPALLLIGISAIPLYVLVIRDGSK